MNHLKSDPVCQWLAGERSPAQADHLNECPQCRAELDRFDAALASFRGALQQWSARPIRPVSRTQPLRWIFATAALALVAAVPVYRTVREQQRAAELARTEQLMERVSTGLSRTVPASMEPLMQLVSPEASE